MKIQEQKWHDFTRLLITEYNPIEILGSVQVELYNEPQDDYGTTAYIYALWVDDHNRRMGIAKRLMDAVESEIKKRGHKIVALQWKLQDTPREIFAWYERRGYDEKEFDGHATWALMVKELN